MPAVMQAQVDDIIDGHRSTLAMNAISLSVAVLIVIINHELQLTILLWLALSMAILVLRRISVLYLLRQQIVRDNPRSALFVMSLGAAASGLCWAALPFLIANFAPLGSDAALVILLGGMAAGSVVKQIGYTPLALVFSIPILGSIIFSLVRIGEWPEYLLAGCLAMLIYVFIRRSLWTERMFVSNQLARFEATALADSLTRANNDILRQNTRLEALANRDTLTGLANRMFFNGHLNGDIARAVVVNEQVVLLIIDVDRFKSINDTLGHSAGDTLLCDIGNRLRDTITDGSLIARLGGDEFAVVVTGERAMERARNHANRVLLASRAAIRCGATKSVIGLSIGLAAYPDHGANAEELLACADMALYDAKRLGRRQMREFNPDLKRDADRQRVIEQDLEKAIESGAVTAWFQPQINLATRDIAGFEALVRWQHPQLGFISPPEIVNAAGVVHLSDRLTARIAADVCLLSKRLPELGIKGVTVALNVSPREFALYSVADMLERVTGEYGVDPSLIEIEITEEAILDPEIAGEQLKRLETAGYKLAVDDFGMGHSSLAYLISLKIDRLKIDRSFAHNVASFETNQKLISALVGLGESLGLDIIIEGVETAEDAAILARLGCTTAQGYLFARPMPVKQLEEWIAERQSKTSQTRKTKATHLSIAGN
jgi:diguanylate cyclase (GGDEF)-like protein